MAKKQTGEIGSTLVNMSEGGMKAEIVCTELPTDKDGLERFFGERFIRLFNETRPLGGKVEITCYEHRDTSDLDYKIVCPLADYIELAELNPRSEEFGRAAHRTGKLNIYDYARWIYMRIVKSKMRKYGPAVSKRTILLVYVTHWQFLPSQKVVECIRAMIAKDGCDFLAVFWLITDGKDLQGLEQVHPFSGTIGHKPAEYKGFTLTNLEPGNWRWRIQG